MAKSDPAQLIQPGSLSPENGPTEISLAEEWVAIRGRDWRYDHTIGRWFNWDGQCWVRDDRRSAHFEIGQHLKGASRSSRQRRIESNKTIRGVESIAASHGAIALTNDCWDSDPWLLGTPGGTVDLRTGKMMRATPDRLITKLTAVAPEQGEPIRWLHFLLEAVGGDQEILAFLKRWCGYLLTGCTREHAFVFITGPGGNGKSVFLNTVIGVLADYATTAAMETFTNSRFDRHPTELAMLMGSRLVTASETEQGRGWNEAKVKSITGGDPITARFMRQDNFTFTPQFKLMMVGNYPPSLRTVDEAMRRRLHIIAFTGQPASPDRELGFKLKGEWPQILSWMIEGCLEWQAMGLQPPEALIGATERYFTDQDTFGLWLEEQCEVGPDKWERPSPLYRSWCEFAIAAGEQTGSQKDFKALLERRGFPAFKSNGERGYRGLSLRKTMNRGGRDS